MKEAIEVTTTDGNLYKIYVIEMFKLAAYPNREYIAYTFGQTNEDMVESYVSIINETNDSYSLEAITDKAEWNEVQEGLKELLMKKVGEVNNEN